MGGKGKGIILIPTLPHARSQFSGMASSPTLSLVLLHQGQFYCADKVQDLSYEYLASQE